MSTQLLATFVTEGKKLPEYRDIMDVVSVKHGFNEAPSKNFATEIKFSDNGKWLVRDIPPHFVAALINQFKTLEEQQGMKGSPPDLPLGIPRGQPQTRSYIIEFTNTAILCHVRKSDAATPWKIESETHPITIDGLPPLPPPAAPRARELPAPIFP